MRHPPTHPCPAPAHLTEEERATYEWQMGRVPGFGEAGQCKLKAATVLVSRLGGVGGTVAYYLAAAGVGRLILAHAGNVRPSDLNRQILMTHDWLGKPRVESAARRLRELNPRLIVQTVSENICADNAADLVARADLVVDAAPLFTERFAMNAAVAAGKPMVECAMFEMEVQFTTILPGRTPCLACMHHEAPPTWKRRFPVIGAMAGTIGCLAAVEAIKVLSQLGEPLAGRMLLCDLKAMSFRTLQITRAILHAEFVRIRLFSFELRNLLRETC